VDERPSPVASNPTLSASANEKAPSGALFVIGGGTIPTVG